MKINSKKYAKAIRLYQYVAEDFGDWLVNITKVEASWSFFNKITVTVTSHRPGIFIGAKGAHIKSIQSFLCEHFGQNIEVRIKEDKMFQ